MYMYNVCSPEQIHVLLKGIIAIKHHVRSFPKNLLLLFLIAQHFFEKANKREKKTALINFKKQ